MSERLVSDRAVAENGRQLTLSWPHQERLTADDFLVGEANRRAWDLLAQWPKWPEPVLRLSGPAGSGKSHLAAIFAERVGALHLRASALDADAVLRLDASRPLVVDDCDGGGIDEHALFHLLNRLRAERGGALLVSRTAPQHWGIATADLLSRLRLSPVVEIGPPDDALFKAVLVKLFADRQLIVDASVIDYLALRLDRSIATAREVVIALDSHSLSLGRKLTRPVAAQLLRDPAFENLLRPEQDIDDADCTD